MQKNNVGRSPATWRSPTFWQNLIWLLPIVMLVEANLRPIAEPDLFFYFALVERFLTDHVWPTGDPFVYTLPNDQPMTMHQWLGYWFFYLPYNALGWTGPILFKSILVTSIMAIPLLPFCKKRLRPPAVLALVFVLIIFSSHHRFRERVSLFGDLFTLSLVTGLLLYSENRRFWLGLPVLFWLWAQIHPSYPMGWFLLLAFVVTSFRQMHWNRTVVCSLILCFVLPFLHPLGWQGVFYPFQFSWNVEPLLSKYVVEWLPLYDSRVWAYQFLFLPYLTLIPFSLWLLWRQRSALPNFAWVVFLLACLLITKSIRFGLIGQALLMLLMAWTLSRESKKPLNILKSPILVWSAFALSAILVAGSGGTKSSWRFGWNERFQIDTNYFPDRAVDFLDNHMPKMNIFNSFGYGGYLAWRWQGNPRIFFHGFSTNFKFYEENYDDPQTSLEKFNQLTEKFKLGVFLLSRIGNDQPYIQMLERNASWQKLYEDNAAVIFAKRDPNVF